MLRLAVTLSIAMQPEAAAPLEATTPRDDAPEKPWIARPLNSEPPPVEPPLDPKRTSIVRVDLTSGPLFRLRVPDALVATGVEYGRMHGFSGAFHTGIIIASDRRSVRGLEFPIGIGAIVRGRLPRRPLFASIGLTIGMLVHRAGTDRGVIRRVDPDLRLPIRFAWTIEGIGISFTIEQGYSVRGRSYEDRGAAVWARHAYRIGFTAGLHFDLQVRSPKAHGPRKAGR